jgi:cytochrome c553
VRRILVWAVLIAVFGCGEERRAAAPETTKQEPAAPVHERPTEVEMVASMEAHYNVVILAHDALIQGNLAGFRSQLLLVPEQELPPSSPKEWLPLHERLQTAAREGAKSSDLAAAAKTIAPVVLACGICHAALDTGPVYPAPAPDDGADAVKTAMLDHQWVTERLWEGVTGPWNNAWERGAEALSVVEVFGDKDLAVTLSDDLRRREQELREIGEEAKSTTALDERAALYGRLLSTCGECHQAIGVTFEPPK